MTNLKKIQDDIRALGPVFNPTVQMATKEIYRPHIDMSPAIETTDLRYGIHQRQRLDLYRPKATATAVVLFIHGGGFIGGDKNEDGVFYVNVGRYLARNGLIGVLASYRHAPEFTWPAATHDVRDAVSWWHRNAVDFGAAALPVYVVGQSAGACHVASWLFDDETRRAPLDPVAGVMLLSGYYRAVTPMGENIQAYFGKDEATYARRSPLSHITSTDIPLLLSVAEYDPGIIASRTYELAAAVSLANGRSPDVAYLKGHNHVSTVMSLGSEHDSAGEVILRFAGVVK